MAELQYGIIPDLERSLQLVAEQAVSRQEYDNAQAARLEAEAALS